MAHYVTEYHPANSDQVIRRCAVTLDNALVEAYHFMDTYADSLDWDMNPDYPEFRWESDNGDIVETFAA